jgi:tetratricopeptide (TPR) repeat protein
MADCLPSISGRGLLPSPVPCTAKYPRRNNIVFSTKKPVLSSSSYSLSMEQTEQPGPATPATSKETEPREVIPISSKPIRDREQLKLSLPPRPGERRRDTEGRSLAGRRKPLKINLDLALYRARQTRIGAQRASDPNDRAKLLREAEAALRKCLDMDPEDGRAYVTLGKLMVQQRRFNEALELYEAGSAATGGTNAHIWTAWAYLAGRRNNAALARRLYDAAIVASPSHAAAYHGWGLLEKFEGNVTRARDVWARGIEATVANPNPYLYQSLAVLAADLDRPEEARKWFRAGTKTVRGAASHALWQAWALMEQRNKSDPEIVRALYTRGLEASPRSRYTFLSWGLWEKEQGKIEAARKLFRQGAFLNPRDAALPQAWALMEEEQNDLETARKLFRRASKADPSHLYVWQAWGCMEQRAGKLDAARELFQQGIWAAPPRASDTSLVFQAWAVLERDAGNIELARELFKCAVKADARSEPSWLAWADMEEGQGLYERANELRSFSMQERQIIVAPASFTTLPKSERAGLLAPMFEQLAKWFQRYDAAGSSGQSGSSGPASGTTAEILASTDSEFELP